MADFLSGVFELFTATDDFLRYGLKRIRILRRAYWHDGCAGVYLGNDYLGVVAGFQVASNLGYLKMKTRP